MQDMHHSRHHSRTEAAHMSTPSTMSIGSFCSGIAGLDDAAAQVFNAKPVWFCEYDAAPSKVLAHHYPDVPNHGDLTATDWATVEPVDIVTAGYPCQPFSTAGQRKGTDDERHLWPAIRDAIRILRPRIVVLENVRGHLSLGFGAVLADLAGLGFDAEWGVFRSSDIGAPHRRERLFVVAHSNDNTPGHDVDSGRPRRRDPLTANAENVGQERARTPRLGRDGSTHDHLVTTDADSRGRDGRATSNESRMGRGHGLPAERSESIRESKRVAGPTADTDEAGLEGREPAQRHVMPAGCSSQHWGKYTAAIRRWEHITGTTAPSPLLNHQHPKRRQGSPKLNPELPEWMMGYPAGWVTDPVIGLSRAQQLKAIGNAVQPQTAATALAVLSHRAGLIQATEAAA